MAVKPCTFQFEHYAGQPGRMLTNKVFQSDNVLDIARYLLGKVLVTTFDGHQTSAVIVECEAYKAPNDRASHAFDNLRTKRTSVMFETGGRAYVYLCYGIHHMFNVVTGPENAAHAILVRAVEPLEGLNVMIDRRSLKNWKYNLTSGPGTLTRALGIETRHTGHLLEKESQIYIEDRDIVIGDDRLVACPRIGIDYAREWAEKPWRFAVRDSPWVSHRSPDW